ncbi:cupin-like domain-containing protein [Dyella sp. C11]|uniref:lysine-specific demethylase n=1 Tax=Dyella sp. C11 TaxID=2126991 RepID=UPI001300291D|nr:cupin-like domain-containing protein [Dyella sp. C11]
MNAEAGRLIEVDWDHFDPWRIQGVRHGLMSHPLLKLPALMNLSKRLEARGRVRTHSNDATPGTPFNTAPKLHPNRMSAASTLEQIEKARAWMSLLNVQTDEVYRTLVDDVLNDIKPAIDRVDPGMCYRGGWIFITSPNTVTPFHFDKEHNFILQVSGRKTIYVWDHRDTVAASEKARDRFHACHERDRLQWAEELRERATVFHLEPGQGAYMPSTSPHMVENGDNASITISFTYYTDATRRDSLLHAVHERLRAWGIEPAAVGQRPVIDSLLHAGFRSAINSREWLRRSLGKRPSTDSAAYAIAT